MLYCFMTPESRKQMFRRRLLITCVLLPMPVGFFFSFLYDAVNDENIRFAFRWLLLPAAGLALYCLWDRYRIDRQWSLPKLLLASMVTGLFIAFMMAGGFVLAVNAFTGSGLPYEVRGRIVEKPRGGLKSKGPALIIVDGSTGERVKIYVPKREWDSLALEEVYSKVVRKGGLGIRYYDSPYRRR